MIDARELRIGNWVYHTNTFCKPEMQLEFNLMKLEFHNGEYPEFNPIPLTPEVLEKCGFEDHKMYGWNILNNKLYKRIGVFIDIKEVRIMMPYFNGVMTICNTMQYLHHLQNLIFTLTDEELTVNL